MAGVAALGERHVEERTRAGQFLGELKKLRHSKIGHQGTLEDLQREARANNSSFADIQVVYLVLDDVLSCCCYCDESVVRTRCWASCACLPTLL